MNTNVLRTTAFLALCLVGCQGPALTDEYSGKFVLAAEHIGAYTFSYTLTNNHEWIDVIEWTIHWNPNDWADDLDQALANFDSATGVIPPLPSYWAQVPAVFPWFWIGNGYGAIKHGGGSLGGYKVRYGTANNPNPTLPLWFTITYKQGNERRTSSMLPIDMPSVPEPSGVLAVGSAVIGMIGRARAARRGQTR